VHLLEGCPGAAKEVSVLRGDETQMTRHVKILLILGVFLTVAPPSIGLLFTAISMCLAFYDLSSSPSGIADPQPLAQHIGFTLEATFLGIVFSAVGITLLMVAAILLIFKRPSKILN
jgi:biopolymer transport protein ExbB/TolQ